MITVQIPEASLARLRQLYAQFDGTAALVAEALGIPPAAQRQIRLDQGVFLYEPLPENGHGLTVEEIAAMVNTTETPEK